MPPDPGELLRQADTLAGTVGATQADLRRAISAAYYAVFHFCLIGAADMVCGPANRSSVRYSVVYRSVDHKTLSGLCRQISQTHPRDVVLDADCQMIRTKVSLLYRVPNDVVAKKR
jgi:hypothetical protein